MNEPNPTKADADLGVTQAWAGIGIYLGGIAMTVFTWGRVPVWLRAVLVIVDVVLLVLLYEAIELLVVIRWWRRGDPRWKRWKREEHA